MDSQNEQRDELQNHQREDRPQSYHNERSIGRLIRDLMLELMSLIQNEAALARAEVSENVSKIKGGAVALVLAVVLLLVGLIGLMLGAIYGLAVVWPMWLSALVIGGAIVVVGLIAAFIGQRSLKARNLTLKRTTADLRKDVAFAREQTQ